MSFFFSPVLMRVIGFSVHNRGIGTSLQEHYWQSHPVGSFAIRDRSLGDYASHSWIRGSSVLADYYGSSGPSIINGPFTFENSDAFDGPSTFDGSDAFGGGPPAFDYPSAFSDSSALDSHSVSDGFLGWDAAGAGHGPITSIDTTGPVQSAIWNPNAEFDIPAFDILSNGNSFLANTNLTSPISPISPMFSPYSIARPSTTISSNPNSTHHSMAGWNPILTDSSPFEAGFAGFAGYGNNTNPTDPTDLHGNYVLDTISTSMPLESQPDNHALTSPPASSSSPSNHQRIPCLECGQTFARKSDLQRHARKHDPNVAKLSCTFADCPYVGEKGFLRADKLRSHARNVHGV